MLKNSLPTSAPFFAGWLSRRVTAHRANNFWRPADWQCERGLQHLLTRILKTVQEGRNDREQEIRCGAIARLYFDQRYIEAPLSLRTESQHALCGLPFRCRF
jgi:hypothetical protein